MLLDIDILLDGLLILLISLILIGSHHNPSFMPSFTQTGWTLIPEVKLVLHHVYSNARVPTICWLATSFKITRSKQYTYIKKFMIWKQASKGPSVMVE